MQELSPDEMMRRVDEFLISIGPDTGAVLNILVKSLRARTILEIGTSYGHSTVFLAEAARANKGRVITVDIRADKQRYADEQPTPAGLDSFVGFLARDLIASTIGLLGFVLIDLWKDLYTQRNRSPPRGRFTARPLNDCRGRIEKGHHPLIMGRH